MTYRDDREALHARTSALEAELADAQRELELLRARDELAGEEAERLRSLVDRLSRGRRPFASSTAPGQRPWWVWAYVSALVLGMGSFVAFAGSTRHASIVPLPVPLTPRTCPHPPLFDLGVLPRSNAEPVELQLPARLVEGSGAGLRPGTSCTVHARITPGTSGLEAAVDVICPRDRSVYAWADEVRGGISMRECRAWEYDDEDGGFRYELDCRDEGARTGGRPELRLDTAGARLDVWREDGADPFRLSFEVAGPATSWRGRPLLTAGARAAQAFIPVDRAGVVERVTGAGAPVAVGESCSLRVVEPPDSRFNCRVFLRCGGELLYGGGSTGYTTCTTNERRPTAGHDGASSADDGDAMLDLDLDAARVVVGDRAEDGAWSAIVQLDR